MVSMSLYINKMKGILFLRYNVFCNPTEILTLLSKSDVIMSVILSTQS